MSDGRQDNSSNSSEKSKSSESENNSNKSFNSTENDFVEEIPMIPFEKICEVTGHVYKEGESSIREDYQMEEGVSMATVKSVESIEYIEVGPEQLINIKKVPKYKVINNYIKGEILGQGVFAKVREFIHVQTLERFAAKIIKIEKMAKMGPNVEENVKKEVQLVGKLDHKNIIKMIDISWTKLKIYVFMEYCAGVLKEIVESAPNQRLPKSQTHNYFCQLIQGLEHLHNQGVYHRDIKEDNLLISNLGVIKIADFGVSFILDPYQSNDMITGFEGTLRYQPPELMQTDIEQYSGSKFDIWSSGVLLFKVISGKYPFFNDDNTDIWNPNAYDSLQYPEVITTDIQLLNLFKKIFIKDFNDRITIEGIKNHAWFIMNHKKDEEHVELPNKQFGDIYRGMTCLERIRVHYYQEDNNQKEFEFCNQADYEESLKPKNPHIFPNRIRVGRSSPKRRGTPMHKLIQLGLYRKQDE